MHVVHKVSVFIVALAEATEADKQLEEEADIMKHVLQKAALKAVKELAQVRVRYQGRVVQRCLYEGTGALFMRSDTVKLETEAKQVQEQSSTQAYHAWTLLLQAAALITAWAC